MNLSLEQLLDQESLPQRLARRGMKDTAASDKAALFAGAAQYLLDRGGTRTQQAQAFFVPGRIEVLGKHTDYAGGRSIVSAMEQGFCWVALPIAESVLRVGAVKSGEEVEFDFAPQLDPRHGHWSIYPMTVARRLARNFPTCMQGAHMVFASDLPRAAGMSSSSAMMIATYLPLAAINNLEQNETFSNHVNDKLSLAAYLGTIENGQSFGALSGDKGVGTFGGSEDHTAILCSEAGSLGQFAYCPARFERRISMPQGYSFAIGFSGIVAEKTGAAQEQYNRAVSLVAAIVVAWQQATGKSHIYLADILASAPQAAQHLHQILGQNAIGSFTGGELQMRLQHFIAENEEIIGPAGDALAALDLPAFGKLVDRSQELTHTLLGNQVPQTIALARLARSCGAVAASAFGAGFGGSVWALIKTAAATPFLKAWSGAYAEAFPSASAQANFFLTGAGPAAFDLGEEL